MEHSGCRRVEGAQFACYALSRPLLLLSLTESRRRPDAVSQTLQITRVLSPIGATLVDAGAAAADVNAMARRGVPVFGLMQDERMYFNYHHTAADTLDKIAPHELAENAAAMAVLGFALADMPQSLARSTGSQ